MKKEEFKVIEGFEDYEVSNLGNVKSLKFGREKILKPTLDNNGYYLVGLSKNGKARNKQVHKLVAMIFLNHKSDITGKIVIDHINNDPLDNRLENLQIITNRENASKDKQNKTSKYTGVSWCKHYNKWRSQICINGKNISLGKFDNEEDANKMYKNKLKSIL